MHDGLFFEKSNEIFKELLDLANKEFLARRITVEPSVIVDKIITPLKELYLRKSVELLEAYLKKFPDQKI